MTANGASERLRVISFKHFTSRRKMLEAIQHERLHPSLGHTIREAVDEYIERYLRNRNEAA